MTNELNRPNETASQQSSTNGQDGLPPEGCAKRAPGDGPACPFSPWYSPHTGTELRDILTRHDLQTRQKRAKIYPSGVKIEAVKTPFSPFQPLVGCVTNPDNVRGDIEGFSHEAARRLREWFMSREVLGFDLWAITLTTHANLSPDDWRAAMMRFRQAVKRAGWAGSWRVELQKRKAPHAHVAFWLPPGVGLADVFALWLHATGETNDQASRQHAVQGRQIPPDETGWAVYMGLHDGKHKSEQLGWKGKQWGIWNRELFTEREAVELVLSETEHALFLRILRNWDVADRMRRERDREAREDAEMVAKICADNGGKLPSCFEVRPSPIKRPKPRLLHRGNLLRLLDGEFVAFVLAAIQTGRVGAARPAQCERITREMVSAASA